MKVVLNRHLEAELALLRSLEARNRTHGRTKAAHRPGRALAFFATRWPPMRPTGSITACGTRQLPVRN
ncbi:hypothetical protein ACF08B_36555 [Streptomyces sp. NPDC015139]|uniref:hypothetical protein n=1 Tax=Streptomyces sp. NPDC015139 TaxID=3364942 RepID=UPI00370287D7